MPKTMQDLRDALGNIIEDVRTEDFTHGDPYDIVVLMSILAERYLNVVIHSSTAEKSFLEGVLTSYMAARACAPADPNIPLAASFREDIKSLLSQLEE